MKKLSLIGLLLISFSVSGEEVLSCPELIGAIKKSNCLKPVAPFLEGAHVKLGLAVQSLTMKVETGKDDPVVKAQMSSTGSLSPYYSIGFKNNYFGDSGFGYAFGLAYLDSYALEQNIKRDSSETEVDLGTYVTTSMYALQPTLFFSRGARNNTPDTYFKAGIGATVGYSSVRGTSYLTEDINSVSPECWQAGEDLLGGAANGIAAIKSECEQISYKDSGWGAGGRFFIHMRWNQFLLGFNAANMVIRSGEFNLNPTKASLTLTYVVNI
mgnify:CR=1 FL=1